MNLQDLVNSLDQEQIQSILYLYDQQRESEFLDALTESVFDDLREVQEENIVGKITSLEQKSNQKPNQKTESNQLTHYASTRLNQQEKEQLLELAAKSGKYPSQILREAFQCYVAYYSSPINALFK